MSECVQYILVIDTNCYAGNFERTVYKFLTRREEDEDDVYDSYRILEKDEGECENFSIRDWFDDNLDTHIFDDEYGEQPVGIYPNPAYLNNGRGTHYRKSAENEKGWPAYLSVAIAVRTQPPLDVLEAIITELDRLLIEYPKVIRHPVDGVPSIERIRVLKIVTSIKEEVVASFDYIGDPK